MVKLRNVVGRGPGRPGHTLHKPEEPRPMKRKSLSEGFAMGPRAESEPMPSLHEAYSGPKAYSRGSMDKALRLAKHSKEECVAALLAEVDAQSSRATLRSLQSTWERLAAQAGFSNSAELTPNLVFTVVGVLKAADYRSAANYLEAAKRRHIQAGFPMTDQLRQACKMAIRSSRRDLGPSKQAEPIKLAVMANFRVKEAADPEGPLAPGRACLLASWWLLREIEASHARMDHVSVDWSKKQVDWQLPNSKTDPMALGTSRSHTCSCSASSEVLCPFHAMAAQLAFAATSPGNASRWLFPTAEGKKPSKQGWARTFTCIAQHAGLDAFWENGAPKHTGHSARASGACHLAEAGVDLWRVQIFGRWSSAAFLKYVRSSPLASLHTLASETAISASIAAAKRELRALVHSSSPVLEDPKQVIPVSDDMIQEAEPGQEPPLSETEYVCNSAAGGKLHVVSVKGEDFHPRHWRTRCGWYFGRGLTNYSVHTQIPPGKPCKVCMPQHRHSRVSRGSSSETSSSSSA